jgi:predicted O-methyltransferase YrrM
MDLYQMRPPGPYQDGLRDLIRAAGFTRPFIMVEIGSFAGESAEIFLEFNPETLYCVDPWTDYVTKQENAKPALAETVFDQRLQRWLTDGKCVVKVKESGLVFAEQIRRRSIDIVYIDAIHTYKAVSADIQAWLPCIKHGGWIAGHDWNWGDVQRAVKHKLGHLGQPRMFVDHSWLFQVP